MAKLPILKILITISIYCCVFANGICSNIYGPSWLDLKSLMNVTLEKMAISISLRAAFFCGGAIIGAFIYKLIDRGALYPIFILIKGLCVALIPLFANYYAFLFYSAMIGLVSGAADTSVNVWMLDIWKDRSAPFVQALQFFWSCGFIVSPLISNPFLSQESISKNKAAAKDIVSAEDHLKIVKESKLYIPYVAAGSICLVGSISLLIIYIYRRIQRCALKNKLEDDEDKQANNSKAEDKKDDFEDHSELDFTKKNLYLIQILLYSCIITSVFCASEMTTFQFVATFVVKLDLGLTKFTGSMIMTAVASSFAIGRFCGILTALRFKPLHILLFDWSIILLGNVILLFSNYGVEFLWIGAIFIGFGYASFFAAIFSYLRDRIKVTTKISSAVILASLSGNAIGYPVFIGSYLESMPLMMVYGNIVCCVIMLICFIGLSILDCKFGIKANIIRKLKKSQTTKLNDK